MYCFDCLLERVGLNAESVGYRYFNFGGKAMYLAGFKELLSLSEEEVVFRLKNRQSIYIVGERLFLKEMDTEMVMITGEINSVEVR